MLTAELIRQARERAGLTQQQLAGLAGTTQSAVSRWERDGSAPSLETLERIVRVCGLDLKIELGSLEEHAASQEGHAASQEQFDQLGANLALTPTERLEQLRRTVRFIEAGRRAMEQAVGG